MTEITCPVCGKLNPAGAETCWSCLSSLSGEGIPPAPPPSGDPDWLSGLRGDTSHLEGDGTGIPDWLTRIRQRQEEEEAAQAALLGSLGAPAEPEGEDAVPDWLAGLTGEPAEAQLPAEAGTETPDWLARLNAIETPDGADETSFLSESELSLPAEPGDETPDWLAGL